MELGWISAIDSNGRTISIADAHRDDGKRFIVRADELLTVFLELEIATSGQGKRRVSRLGGRTCDLKFPRENYPEQSGINPC